MLEKILNKVKITGKTFSENIAYDALEISTRLVIYSALIGTGALSLYEIFRK